MNIGVLSNDYDYCHSLFNVINSIRNLKIVYLLSFNTELIFYVNMMYPDVKTIDYSFIEKDHKLKTEKRCKAILKQLRKIKHVDLQVTYGFEIIHKVLWDYPTYKTINVHFSLLPEHKGPRPLQSVLKSGDSVTGVTIHYVTDEVDGGEILDQIKINVDKEETLLSLNSKSIVMCEQLLKKTLLYILIKKIKSNN